MYFNEKKYKNCISRLIDLKTFIIISCIFIFSCLGACVGILLTERLGNNWYVISISVGTGFLLGLMIGLFSTWRVEMQIQEAYWKIDIINEFKKQTSMSNKNIPIAKTIVAIENKSPSDEK